LRVDSNKAEHFQFLISAVESATAPEDKLLVTTKKENVSTNTLDVSALQPYTHDEQTIVLCFIVIMPTSVV